MARISLLHITDLHYASPDSNYRDDDKEDLPGALKESYFSHLHAILRPDAWLGPSALDAIAMTGDFTTHGQAAGFDSFEEHTFPYLVDLVPPRALCMVPGNHDVVWNLDSNEVSYFDKKFKRYLDCVETLGATTSYIPTGRIPDDPYAEITFKSGVQGPAFFDQEKKILILCINSAMRCGEVNKPRRANLTAPVASASHEIDKAIRMMSRGNQGKMELSLAKTYLDSLAPWIEKYSLSDIPHVTRIQLDKVRNTLRSLEKTHNVSDEWIKIAMLHHHLSPFDYQIPEHKPFELMADASAVLDFLATSGFHIVLTGHKHQSYKQSVQSRGRDMLILGGMTVGGAPVTGFPPSIRHLEIQQTDGLLEVHVADLTCNEEGVGGVADALEAARLNPIFISKVTGRAKRLPFPKKIEDATDKQIYGLAFYKKNVVFNISVSEAENHHLVFTTNMSYTTVNKTNGDQRWPANYNFDHGNGKILSAYLNGKPHNPDDREFLTGRGVSITQTLGPHKELDVSICAQEEWPEQGSALYTSYHPAADFKLSLSSFCSNIDFDFEVLYSYSAYPVERNKDEWEVELKEGLLPYQGVKVTWKIRKDRNGNY